VVVAPARVRVLAAATGTAASDVLASARREARKAATPEPKAKAGCSTRELRLGKPYEIARS